MITMQSWMFLSSYEKLHCLTSDQPANHLDAARAGCVRAFDSIGGEVVSSTAFVPGERANGKAETLLSAGVGRVFIPPRRRDVQKKKVTALNTALEAGPTRRISHLASDAGLYDHSGSPIVYWLSERCVGSLRQATDSGRSPRSVGLQTGDNSRFFVGGGGIARSYRLRNVTEEAKSGGAVGSRHNKGGEVPEVVRNQEHVVNWEDDGADIRVFRGGVRRAPRSDAQNTDTYFSPSVSWSDISSGEAAFRRYHTGSSMIRRGTRDSVTA